jgi:multicomponent K+:H+ antiporter subunit E
MIRNFARSISPALVAGLTVLWLLLNQSISPGHIGLGIGIGAGVAWASSTLRPLRVRLARTDRIFALLLVVLYDIVRSNVGVARIVLGLHGGRKINPDFLDIPLTLRDPHAVAVLAMIVTCTPGAVWVGLSPDGKVLRLHVLDLVDEQYWIHLIQDRYERYLMRIFE